MSRPIGLLFDWDNTLVESWHHIHQSWNKTLTNYGKPTITLTEVQKLVRLSAKDSFPEIFGDQATKAIQLYRTYYAAIDGDPTVIDEVEKLLQFCLKVSLPCGVISNKSHDFLVKEINNLQWHRYFSLGFIGAGYAETDKPDARTLSALSPDYPQDFSYWYIGDTGIDTLFAHNTKMRSVLIGDNVQQGDLKPDMHYNTIKEFYLQMKLQFS